MWCCKGRFFSLLFWLLCHICKLQKDFSILLYPFKHISTLKSTSIWIIRKFRWMNATWLFYFFSFLCSFGLLQQDKPDEISLLLSATSLILLNSCWFIMHSSHQVCEGTISLMLDVTANYYRCIEKPQLPPKCFSAEIEFLPPLTTARLHLQIQCLQPSWPCRPTQSTQADWKCALQGWHNEMQLCHLPGWKQLRMPWWKQLVWSNWHLLTPLGREDL